MWPDMVSDCAEMWSERSGERARFAVTIPKIDAHFTGTGDLTAALILAWSASMSHAMPTVCRRMVAALRAVCLHTQECPPAGPEGVPPELRIVQCKRILEDPPVPDTIRMWAL